MAKSTKLTETVKQTIIENFEIQRTRRTAPLRVTRGRALGTTAPARVN